MSRRPGFLGPGYFFRIFNNFNSIGMYVNTLPVIVNCKNQDIASFMENMGSLIYDVMRYNYYPFRLLASEFNLNNNEYKPESENAQSGKAVEEAVSKNKNKITFILSLHKLN